MRIYSQPIRIFIFFTVVFSLPMLVHAQIYSEKREKSKSFKLRSGTEVQISNKYGNINVLPWEKDSVRIQVSISAQSKQASKVIKILSSIDCEMLATNHTISARTVFYDNSATFWKDVVSYAGKLLNANNNLSINYTVYMPSTYALKMENKFGNVYMDDHKGNTDLTITNGDLQARNFSSTLKLDLEFGTASLYDVNDARFNINYSNLSLRKVNALNLNSRSSTIEIEEASTIEIESQRDKLVVNTCGSISGETAFSKIRLNELESITSMKTRYGELKINRIPKNFRVIYLNSEFTDIFLGLMPMTSYSIDLVYDNKTKLNISPSILSHLKKEVMNLNLQTIKAIGNIGKPTISHISVTAKSGYLTILPK